MREGRTKQRGAQTVAQGQAANDAVDLGGYEEYLGRGYVARLKEVLEADPKWRARLLEHYRLTANGSRDWVLRELGSEDWYSLTPRGAAELAMRYVSALENFALRVVLAQVAAGLSNAPKK